MKLSPIPFFLDSKRKLSSSDAVNVTPFGTEASSVALPGNRMGDKRNLDLLIDHKLVRLALSRVIITFNSSNYTLRSPCPRLDEPPRGPQMMVIELVSAD